MSQSQREFQNRKQIANTLYPNNKRHSRKFTSGIPTEAYISKGKALYQAGQLKPALTQFEEAIKNCPEVPPDVYHLAGVISIALNNYSQAQNHFHKLQSKNGNYKANTHLFLAISLHKTGKDDEALHYLNLLCEEGSDEGLIYRGKILFKKMKFQQAAEDFRKLIERKKAIPLSNIFLYECLLRQDKFQEAEKGLESLLQIKSIPLNPENKKKVKNLQTEILIKKGKLEEAMEVVMSNLKDSRDSETLYLKSCIHRFNREEDDRILALNQCITVKNSKKAVVKALEELIIGSLEQRDFYEAFQYSKRSLFMNITNKSTNSLYKLSEGLTFLMKKKFGEALLMIGAIDTELFKNYDKFTFLKNLCFSALGYAYFSLGQHGEALKIYRKIELSENDESHRAFYFNIKLCEGIQSFNDSKIEQAIKIFESSTDYLIRPEPYLYISVILIQKGLSSNASSQLFMQVLEIIDTGLKVGENCQMFYYRSLLYFYLGMNAEALDDVDRAIEKSEDNVARYFYLRALIFFQERNYEQGIAECTTCISIDQNFYEAYLERAKMKLICNETDEAYEDISQHPLKSMWIPLFELYQKNFYSIIENQQAQSAILQTAHFHLGQFDSAGPAGNIIQGIICENYSQVIDLLNEALEISFPIGCLELDDIYLLKSYCNFKLSKLQQALQFLNRSQEILKKSESSITYSEEDQRKLLAIKINGIFISLKKNNLEEAEESNEILIGEVYEGPIYDQLIKLRDFIVEAKEKGESKLSFNIFDNVNLISDYLLDDEMFGGKFKFIIPMPKIKILDIQVVPYQQPLLDFTIKEIQNKAEAPWMRKDENGVIFTNVVQKFQNLNLCTEENEDLRTSKQRIKEQLQLDSDVLHKLEKLEKLKAKKNEIDP